MILLEELQQPAAHDRLTHDGHRARQYQERKGNSTSDGAVPGRVAVPGRLWGGNGLTGPGQPGSGPSSRPAGWKSRPAPRPRAAAAAAGSGSQLITAEGGCACDWRRSVLACPSLRLRGCCGVQHLYGRDDDRELCAWISPASRQLSLEPGPLHLSEHIAGVVMPECARRTNPPCTSPASGANGHLSRRGGRCT